VEEPMKKDYKNNYKPNYTEQIISTKFKLEQLQLLRDIADIDAKLNTLEMMHPFYPPQNADDDQPSAVHTAPSAPTSSDQEN
jgi:hypothetical protein